MKGVALLVVNHTDRASDQWMWTPAIERDRRVAFQDRSTRFFGTDFTFEDLEERDVDQYEYALLGEEAIDGVPCWKVQSTPTRGQVVAVHEVRRVVSQRQLRRCEDRVLYQGRSGATPGLSDVRQLQGIWTAHELTMTDLKRGSRTRLALEKVQYNVPLKDDDFTLQAIRR